MSRIPAQPSSPVSNGPSREELFDALRLRNESRTVSFTFLDLGRVITAEVFVFGIYARDGRGHNWFIFAGMKGSSADYLFSYSTESRQGFVRDCNCDEWHERITRATLPTKKVHQP